MSTAEATEVLRASLERTIVNSDRSPEMDAVLLRDLRACDAAVIADPFSSGSSGVSTADAAVVLCDQSQSPEFIGKVREMAFDAFEHLDLSPVMRAQFSSQLSTSLCELLSRLSTDVTVPAVGLKAFLAAGDREIARALEVARSSLPD